MYYRVQFRFDGEKACTLVHDLKLISLVEVNRAIKAWSHNLGRSSLFDAQNVNTSCYEDEDKRLLRRMTKLIPQTHIISCPIHTVDVE